MTPTYMPAALNDLDAPIRVGAARLDQADRFSGRRLGVHNGCVILYWTMNEREGEAWMKRRQHS